jgi:hypothetical protein
VLPLLQAKDLKQQVREMRELVAAAEGLQQQRRQLEESAAGAQELRAAVAALQQQVSQLPGLHLQQAHLEQQLLEVQALQATVARLEKEVGAAACSPAQPAPPRRRLRQTAAALPARQLKDPPVGPASGAGLLAYAARCEAELRCG